MKKNPTIFIFISLILVFIILLAYAITCGIYAIKGYAEQKEAERQEKIRQEQIRIEKIKQEQERKRKIREQRKENIKRIHFNQPRNLNYSSKEEIYKQRKLDVFGSIFSDLSYEPSEEVFGQIESNKPWNSMKQCKYKVTNESDIDGPSEEARYINNPELLVAPEYAFYDYYCGERSTQEVPYSRPLKITYFKDRNTIEIVYGGLPYCTQKGKTWYSLKGLNARDLGYKYAYIDKEKTTLDIDFVEETNASNSIVEFQDFIHVGGSCGHEGGCNNASPNQPPLNFYYSCDTNKKGYDRNKIIYIKLWKNKPSSPTEPADMVEILKFVYS